MPVPNTRRVYDKIANEGSRAATYDGTAEGLAAVCQFHRVIPASGGIQADGATMIHHGADLLTLLPGDTVVAPCHRYHGGVYDPQTFAKRFLDQGEA